MIWIIAGVVWLLVNLALGVLIGKAIHYGMGGVNNG